MTDNNKSIIDLINNRRTIRCFNNKKVDADLIKTILESAIKSPTGGNLQPYHIAIIQGKSKEKLSNALIHAFEKKLPIDSEYDYYPTEAFEPFNTRRHFAGVSAYKAANIKFSQSYVDWAAVINLVKQNYVFFGADVGLIFYMDNRLTEGAHIDIGLLMQNIMLLAEHFGLGTCPQASMVNYSSITKKILNIDANMKIVCGMSLGYIDETANINNCQTDKEPLENLTHWHY